MKFSEDIQLIFIIKLFSGVSQLHVYIEIHLVIHNKHSVTLVTFSDINANS